MSLFDDLDVPEILNGVGPATRLGGLPLADEVLEAMREATRRPMRMDRLQDAAGRRIAAALGVPASYVTSGAAAALHLATCIVMTRGDAAAIDGLPRTDGLRDVVVIQSAHRDPYDRAVEMTGARLREIGYPDTTHPGELERALDEGVAAVLFRPGRRGNLLDLATTAAIARARGVPVIVDGALFAPPVERLHGFFRDGADLVAVSGGKGFRGPQASGLLCGREELIALTGLHHHDMDERDGTWRPPGSSGPTPPRHGPARPMKVGREQIAGLTAAIDRYVRDPGGDDRIGILELDELERLLAGVAGLVVSRHHESSLDVPVLELELERHPVDVVVRALATLPRPVVLGESEAWRRVLTVNPMALRPGDAALLADSIESVLQHPAAPSARSKEQET